MNQLSRNLLFFLAIISEYTFAADNQLEGKYGSYFASKGQIVESEQELQLSKIPEKGKTGGFACTLIKFSGEKNQQRVEFILDNQIIESIKNRTKPFILLINKIKYHVSYIRDENNNCLPLTMNAQLLAYKYTPNYSNTCTLVKKGDNYFVRIKAFNFDLPIAIKNPEFFTQNLLSHEAPFIHINGKEDDYDRIGFYYHSAFLITNSEDFKDKSATKKEVKGILSQLKAFFYNHRTFLTTTVVGIVIIGGVIKLLMAK